MLLKTIFPNNTSLTIFNNTSLTLLKEGMHGTKLYAPNNYLEITVLIKIKSWFYIPEA
tara:strand:- start:50 stop:223 length:174 start_codon:yes stop_codon:yes gene_type:complete